MQLVGDACCGTHCKCIKLQTINIRGMTNEDEDGVLCLLLCIRLLHAHNDTQFLLAPTCWFALLLVLSCSVAHISNI